MFGRLKNWFLYGVFISDELAMDMHYKKRIVIKKPNPEDLDKFLEKEEKNSSPKNSISNDEAVARAKENSTSHGLNELNSEENFELSKEEIKAIYLAAIQTFGPVLIVFIILIILVAIIFF